MGAGTTMAWANTRQNYGLGKATPSTAGAIGGAAGGLAGFMSGNPILGFVLSQVGAAALERMLGGGASPYEQMQKQQMMALKQQLPTIQAQAAGQPSPATQAQIAQLRQSTTRAQQSYGSTALGRGVGQSTPTKATQARFRQAETGAIGDIMGQAQMGAQQQLMQLGVAGTAGLQAQQMQAQQNRQQIYGDLAELMGEWQASKSGNQQLDPMAKQVYDMVFDVFKSMQMQR